MFLTMAGKPFKKRSTNPKKKVFHDGNASKKGTVDKPIEVNSSVEGNSVKGTMKSYLSTRSPMYKEKRTTLKRRVL